VSAQDDHFTELFVTAAKEVYRRGGLHHLAVPNLKQERFELMDESTHHVEAYGFGEPVRLWASRKI